MQPTTTSRFATFELLRICIPGIYFMFLVSLYGAAFRLHFAVFDDPLMAILAFTIGSIVAGMSLYAKETPRKRKAFTANQPSSFIVERSRVIPGAHPLTEEEARRLYFFIMNHEMPPVVHDKIFFFGMIYQIMINIRRTSFWFGLLGAAGCVIQVANTGGVDPSVVVSVALPWIVYILNVRYDKADRKMQENYADQLYWLEMHSEAVDALIRRRTDATPGTP